MSRRKNGLAVSRSRITPPGMAFERRVYSAAEMKMKPVDAKLAWDKRYQAASDDERARMLRRVGTLQ